MKEEIWKDIKDFENLYQISNLGRVKSKKTNKIRHLILYGNYYTVTLSKNGKSTLKRVHRLVAENFISNPNNYNIVNHIDKNKLNNNISNLEWCTQKENVNHTKYLICGPNSKTKDLYIQKEIRKTKNNDNYIYYRVIIRRKNLKIAKGFRSLAEARKFRDLFFIKDLNNEQFKM